MLFAHAPEAHTSRDDATTTVVTGDDMKVIMWYMSSSHEVYMKSSRHITDAYIVLVLLQKG